MKFISTIIAMLFCCHCIAQTTVSGTVTDDDNVGIPGAIVSTAGGAGTVTDGNGSFSFTTNQEIPFDITVSSIGFAKRIVKVTSTDALSLQMSTEANMLDEVVVSASRSAERIFESPVSVETMNLSDIESSAAPSFYDGLENLKGVDVNTAGLTFKSVNTRGFATFANTRFVQLVDGMDNSSPALNFVLGNLVGMSELDVESIELLPGASSALYGANAFNGILFMTSKSPFDYEGISAYAKSGLTSSDNAGSNGFYDVGLRGGKAFSDKFAAKASISFLTGEEWHATDYADYDNPGLTRADPGYNGLNVYGDEVATTINLDNAAMAPAGTFGSIFVSRTGYEEIDLMAYDAQSIKGDVSLHFRPNADDLELIWNSKSGRGNTIYQGANRYGNDNFTLSQHKLEVKADNFFVRGYLTSEDAGDSYDSRFAAINLNRSWKGDTQWFTEYTQAYLGALTGMIPGVPAGDPTVAHGVARGAADTGRLMPGTSAFDSAFNTIVNDPSLLTGAKFQDRTKLYHVDANYNLMNQQDWADIQIGGSFRTYSLNSGGTIFTDDDGPINYNEYGAYTQIQKKFADDALKFTGSLRYDKNEFFDGNVSPRVSMVFSPDDYNRHNIRASYQSGFRNPTTQDLFIGLDVGNAILVGSAPNNLNRYNSRPFGNSMTAQALGFPASTVHNGSAAYNNSWTLSSLQAFGASAAAGTPNPALLQQATPNLVQPEEVQAIELGYRGALGANTFLDISGYRNSFDNFINTVTVVVPNYGQTDFSDITPLPPALGGPTPTSLIAVGNGDFTPFQVYTNSSAQINSYGGTLGLESRANNFEFGANYTLAKLDFDQSQDPDFRTNFNTPENSFKAYFGNDTVTDKLGFMLNFRYNDGYFWESSFVEADVDSRSVLDAQVSYDVPSMKSTFKLGGANILGNEYVSAPGVGRVGSQYFLSWTYN